MKKTLVVVSCLLAVALAASIVLAVRQRGELLGRNAEFAKEVNRLRDELSAARPQASLRRYENRALQFELSYPPELFSNEAPKTSSATARNGMKGVQLTQSKSACTLEVYVGPAAASTNPFDETGVNPKEARYVASSRLDFGGLSYYVGMGVVSHAVDPQRTCIPAFQKILPTFRLVPEAASSAGASVAGRPAVASLDSAGLGGLGVANPEKALREDLMKHPELIPFHGVLGGTPGFHDPGSIVLLPGRWVYATFDDGHVEGRLIAAWEVAPDRTITWRLVAAQCPEC